VIAGCGEAVAATANMATPRTGVRDDEDMRNFDCRSVSVLEDIFENVQMQIKFYW
jgi:hypothetical protein